MSGGQQYPLTGWGHKIREENRGLREKIAGLRKESGGLRRELQNTWKLLDHVPGSLVLVQQEKVFFANETACKETGYTRNELLNLKIGDLIGSDSGLSALSFYSGNTGDQAALHQHEAFLKTKDGRALSVELRLHKTLYQGKTSFLFHAISLDRRKAQDGWSRQSANTEALLRMAFGFRKELNLYNSLLQEDAVRNQRSDVYENSALRFLGEIEAIREREALLSQRLGCMARAEYDPSELTFVNMKGLLETAIDIACPRASAGSCSGVDPVTINTFLRTPSRIYGCGRELQDVFANIIMNAVEALPNGGDVYLTTEEHSGFAHIYIQDNGVGMPQGVLSKIFDPFFTTKDGAWRGLGLSLCHAVIDRHQGEIDVSSQEGRGSTVIVKLPLVRSDSPVRVAASKKGLKDSHILIVGNDDVLTDIICNLFADRVGRITMASSYKEGLRILREARVDLIIADEDTLREDTGRMTRRIKELLPDIPVALINSQWASDSRTAQGKMAADLTMNRPLNLDRFLSQVTRLIERGVAPE
jgi:PAS domain S-box-containing protein